MNENPHRREFLEASGLACISAGLAGTSVLAQQSPKPDSPSHRVRVGFVGLTSDFAVWAVGAAVLGAGTAMVYPTLLAAIGDVAHPRWRARSVGIYRLWRDAGFAVGAVAAGVLADAISIRASILSVAALTAVSGVVVAVRMYETHRPRRR